MRVKDLLPRVIDLLVRIVDSLKRVMDLRRSRTDLLIYYYISSNINPSNKIPNKPRTSHLRSIAPVEQAVAQGTSATEWLVQGLCKQTSYNPSNKRSHKPFEQTPQQATSAMGSLFKACSVQGLRTSLRTKRFAQASHNLKQGFVLR